MAEIKNTIQLLAEQANKYTGHANKSEQTLMKQIMTLSGFTLVIVGTFATSASLLSDLSSIGKLTLISSVVTLFASVCFSVAHMVVDFYFWKDATKESVRKYQDAELLADENRIREYLLKTTSSEPKGSTLIFLWAQVTTYLIGTLLAGVLLVLHIIHP